MFFCDNEFMRSEKISKILSAKFKDYHYQNQPDPWYDDTDDISPFSSKKEAKKDWEERKRIWDEIMDCSSETKNNKSMFFGYCDTQGFIYEFGSLSDISKLEYHLLN